MDIIAAIHTRPHTINRLQLASHQRWREAEVLRLHGEKAGAIYLLGYVAELLMKARFLQLLPGVSGNSPVSFSILKQEYNTAFNLGKAPPLKKPALHNLNDLLVAAANKRASLGLPYSPAFHLQLRGWISTISRQHIVEMRYYPLRPSLDVVGEVHKAVMAMRESQSQL